MPSVRPFDGLTVPLSAVEGLALSAVEGRRREGSMNMIRRLRWNIGAATVIVVLKVLTGGAAAQELYGSVVGAVQDGSSK
jgi:heme A synthase